MPNVWRIRMKSDAGGIDHAAARNFAVTECVVGAGWGLNGSPDAPHVPDGCEDVALYLHHAMLVYPGDTKLLRAADIIGTRIQIGDFCWMYATHSGEYRCCRIVEAFKYRSGGGFDLYDLHLTRRCTWVNAGTADAIPGVIRRAFAGPFGTVSAIKTDARSAIEAAEVILQLREPPLNQDLFAVAGPEDLEDLVSLYLQDRGWSVCPSTSKVSMASYEFVLVHRDTGQRAGGQVKSGNVWALNQAVADEFDLFFVFLTNPHAEKVLDIQSLIPTPAGPRVWPRS